MQVKIRQLKALDAVVRLGSFVEAAQALHVTPAALSLAIRELEECVGFRVLERTTRRLALTDAGRGYLVFAQRVLSELEAAERYARDIHAGHAVVRIATTQTVIATLLTQALIDVHRSFPHIRLQPLDVAANGIVDAFASGAADIAIGVNLPLDEGMESQLLFASRWFAYLASGHPLGRRRQLDWHELAGHSLFMTKSSNYLKLRAALGRSVDLVDVQESTATAGIAMASVGSGIAVFPGYVQPIAKVLGVKCVPIVAPAIPHELYIGVRRQPSSSAPIHLVRDAIARAVAQQCQHLK